MNNSRNKNDTSYCPIQHFQLAFGFTRTSVVFYRSHDFITGIRDTLTTILKPFWGGHSSCQPIILTRRSITGEVKCACYRYQGVVLISRAHYGRSCYCVVCTGVCFIRVGLSRHSLVLLNWLYCTCNWKHLFLGKACCLFFLSFFYCFCCLQFH